MLPAFGPSVSRRLLPSLVRIPPVGLLPHSHTGGGEGVLLTLYFVTAQEDCEAKDVLKGVALQLLSLPQSEALD